MKVTEINIIDNIEFINNTFINNNNDDNTVNNNKIDNNEIDNNEIDNKDNDYETDNNEKDNDNATITYDDYYFDTYDILCDNKNCTTKFSPCGLFINGEVSLCFCCYIKGYRICLLSNDIDLLENMIEFKPKMYKLSVYCNYLLPFE